MRNLFILLASVLCVNAIAQPKITSFTPTSGEVGTSVAITGTSFNATPSNNIVLFGATQATVTAGSVSSLTVTVPTGATYQPISVTDITTGLTAYSPVPFITTFPCNGVLDANSFATKDDFVAGTNPYSVAIGDVDGDGKPDLAVANYNASTVSVLLNTSASGTITFATKADFTTGSGPSSVAIGDIDGDGKPDLAVANYNTSTVSVLRSTSTSGTIAFASKADFATESGPYSVAIGDLDGDGKPDLVVANFNSNTVSVLQSTSTSGIITFAPKVDFTTGSYPYNVAIGDLDGDGKPDLAIANQGSNTVSVLRNTSASGTIAFASKADFTTGSYPYSVAIGDLDGDGKPDLVTANQGSSTVSVFRSTSASGTIAFATRVDFSTGSYPHSVAIGDVDGDGKPDLAVANYGTSTLSVLKNTCAIGTIAFATKVGFTTGTYPNSLAIGDLDGDGKPDLAVANYNSNSASVLRNTVVGVLPYLAGAISGAATVRRGQSGVTYTVLDIANATSYAWTLPTGATGTSTTSSITVDYSPSATSGVITVKGINACGSGAVSTLAVTVNPALITITTFAPASGAVGTTVTITGTHFNATSANNIVLFGATQATVTAGSTSSLTVTVPAGATYQPISVTDITTGLTAYSSMPFIKTFPCGGALDVNSFTVKSLFVTESIYAYSVAIGDVDGDGKPDFAVVNGASNKVSIFRNTSTSGTIDFDRVVDLTTGSSPYSVAIGDVDGDGKPDLAVANSNSNTVSILQNTSISSSISFGSKIDFTTGTAPYFVSIGDMDGDGKPDLAVTNSSSNTVSVLRNISNSGSISFAPKSDFTTGSSPYSVAIGDVDGDGKPDLAVANSSSNTVSVLRNTSTSSSISFAAKVDFTTGVGPRSVAIGDVDGDGKPDLAVVNYNTSTVSVLRSTSTSGIISFSAKVDFATGTGPYSVAIGDVDGDGKPDLAVANYNANTASVLRGTGFSGFIDFAAKIDFTLNDTYSFYPTSVSMGDLDGDSKPDLAFGNHIGNYIYIIRNTVVSGLPNTTGTISGATTVCQGQSAVTYTVPTIANAISYVWTLPTGATGTSTTNSIAVNFGTSAVSGDITVKGTNDCGDGTISTLAITVNPSPAGAGTISGTTTVCQGQSAVTYTVPAIANATTYVWTLPTGATGTSSTNSITIDYSPSAVSGSITVKGTSDCGVGAISTLAISVNPLPAGASTISGTTTVCQGQSAVTYTVPSIANATSYVWTLPTGATGTSTTSTITVDYSLSAVSGNITVKGNNGCGNGASSTLPITVNSKPVTPVISLTGYVLHSDSPIGNQWYSSALIGGATNQEYTAIANGNYYTIVTLLGCSSNASNTINVVITGIGTVDENSNLKVYPNPVSDELTIEIAGNNEKQTLEILNSSGQLVYKGTFVEKTTVKTSSFALGVYIIKLGNGKFFEFKKIIKE